MQSNAKLWTFAAQTKPFDSFVDADGGDGVGCEDAVQIGIARKEGERCSVSAL